MIFLKRVDFFYEYFTSQLNQKEYLLDNFNRGFHRKPDELDSLDYIIALTEYKTLMQVFKDLKVLLKFEENKKC